MLTEDSVHEFIAHLMVNGYSGETCRAYHTDLMQTVKNTSPATDWRSLEVQVATYLNANRSTWSPKTMQRRLSSIRSWARWVDPGINFMARYRAPKVTETPPHPIPEGIDGVKRMIASTRNPRHRALCVLTGVLGLRVDEAVNVKPSDFDLNEMELKVRGKGDKTRVVPVTPFVWKHIERAYDMAVKNGTTLVRLSNSGARKAIPRHGRNAGLSRPIRSHDMRSTAATAMYAATHDLRATQEVLGHANAQTTQRYTLVSKNAMRAAVSSIA